MKVSLVATVKDARPHIEPFLDSVRAQTRQPDEVVIVDGGSSDGTFDILDRTDGVTALSEPGANISTGRNRAVRAATHDAVAVTDADCLLAPDWLERIVAPLEREAHVAAGFYRPLGDSFLQVCAGAVALPDVQEVRPGWMPSSRSVAFRRDAFEAAGGYPEWLDVGEDMYLNHRWVELGYRIELASDAVTYWRVRPSLAATWGQYARYAEGDAVAGMYPERHLIRFGTYSLLMAAIFARSRWPIRLVAVGGIAYAWRPVRRAWRRMPGGPGAGLSALAGVPAMMALIDGAKMWGYLRGLARARSYSSRRRTALSTRIAR